LLKPVAIVERTPARDELRALLDRIHAKQPPTSQPPLAL